MSVVDIKDRTPNETLVRRLRIMLEYAEAGRLRTFVAVLGWDDDAWSHSWTIDDRNSRRRMLGEMSMMQFDLLSGVSIAEGDNTFAEAVLGE